MKRGAQAYCACLLSTGSVELSTDWRAHFAGSEKCSLYGIYNAKRRVRLRKLAMYLGNQSITHWLHFLHDGTGEGK